ncbi:hypothetical protein DTO021C3_2098 [Paecilomyces variotii]|nr:hypothetical protein DTO195F2_3158 [Paecilomyces variotii]KAJ9290474.1 hypothetical protein DTO021C3_2098 [Paecilomyces variotii]KAJ9373686.1 hypothetical protein DTO282E5_1470 [Paecilomyces variotii]KAJ9405405.1 hypothetical protein DTO045G8_6808 [Paecilomyces variotii]
MTTAFHQSDSVATGLLQHHEADGIISVCRIFFIAGDAGLTGSTISEVHPSSFHCPTVMYQQLTRGDLKRKPTDPIPRYSGCKEYFILNELVFNREQPAQSLQIIFLEGWGTRPRLNKGQTSWAAHGVIRLRRRFRGRRFVSAMT